jgi:AcrR family transcriptional regulator
MTGTKPITRMPGKERGGRPRIADLEKPNDDILAAAAELFLQHGFDGTSMDAIAGSAGISKRTLYSRHRDKSSLFNTVIYELLGRLLAPIEKFRYEQPAELESVLLTLARDMIGEALKPELLAVYRIIPFETQRRPQFGRWIRDVRRKPAIHVIARILERHRNELRVTDFEAAAEQFANLAVDSCFRLASLGIKLSPREVDERISAAVDLFISGVRRRDPHAGKSVAPCQIP